MDNQSVRLISSLRFDPGYLLLLDYLQAQLDTLTDELADSTLTDDAAKVKLRYWQAFRDILHTLKTQPNTYAAVMKEDNPSEESPEEDPFSSNDWRRRQQQAWETALQDQLPS